MEENRWGPFGRLATTGWCIYGISSGLSKVTWFISEHFHILFLLITKEFSRFSSPCLPISCLSFTDGFFIPCYLSTLSFSYHGSSHVLSQLPVSWHVSPIRLWVHKGRDRFFLVHCCTPSAQRNTWQHTAVWFEGWRKGCVNIWTNDLPVFSTRLWMVPRCFHFYFPGYNIEPCR